MFCFTVHLAHQFLEFLFFPSHDAATAGLELLHIAQAGLCLLGTGNKAIPSQKCFFFFLVESKIVFHTIYPD